MRVAVYTYLGFCWFIFSTNTIWEGKGIQNLQRTEVRQAGATRQELSPSDFWEAAYLWNSLRPSQVPDLRAATGQVQRWSLHWGCLLDIECLDGSVLTTAHRRWLKGVVQRAMLAMGIAAPALLVLLTLRVTICDAEDTCSGE